jgi:PAS domain S-box-containing protein
MRIASEASGEVGANGALTNVERVAEHRQESVSHELSQLVDTVPSHLWQLTPEGEPVFFNKRMVEFLGVSVKDLTSNPAMTGLAALIAGAIHPDDAAAFEQTLRCCLATGDAFATRYRLRRADGAYRWMSSAAEPLRNQLGRIVQWYGICHDIDDQVHAEQALRRSEQQQLRDREQELSLLVDMVPSHLWRLTPEGDTSLVNKRLADFLGVDMSDQRRLKEALDTIFHLDDADKVGEVLGRCLTTGEHFHMRYRLRRADGTYRWMSGRAEPMRDESGRIVQWFGLCHDIDDQIHAEQALRHSERQLRQMIDAMPVRAFSTTPDGVPAHFNKRYEDYLRTVIPNYDALEQPHIAKYVQDLLHPEDAPEMERRLRKCLETGETFVMRYRRRERDGYRWAEGRMEPLRDQDGAIVQWYGINLDIDDEVRTQEALLQASEKLARATQAASLAELSASIAHEVNQPLAAIVAHSQACQRWLSNEPPNIERALITAERIARDANAASEVVGRIRGLFRQAPHPRSCEDVNLLITEVCRLMADEVGSKHTRIETDLEPDLPAVALDRVQVQQVLVNLIRNGIEAMGAVFDRARSLQVRSCRDGRDLIRVEVRDFGTGFRDNERVVEPFFTTKQYGMGMGLAICRSIVESHGGQLCTSNHEVRGAIVAFTLPVSAREPAPKQSAPKQSAH